MYEPTAEQKLESVERVGTAAGWKDGHSWLGISSAGLGALAGVCLFVLVLQL